MLKSIESKYSESAVSYARELLERCESGQPSRFEAVGMCMEMANQILADTR
jgi:hypothetical protein